MFTSGEKKNMEHVILSLLNSCRKNEYSVRFRFPICPFWRSSAFNMWRPICGCSIPLMYRSEPGPTPVDWSSQSMTMSQ